MAIPATVDGIDARWIADALGAAVVAIDVEPLGAGSHGQLARVSVRYCEAGAGPSTVVVKLSREHEGRFYRECGSVAGIRVPWCFRAQLGGDGSAALVLEDLAGARSCKRSAGVTAADAEAVVDALADFHVTWWDSPHLDELGWMPRRSSGDVRTVVHGSVRPESLFFDVDGGDVPVALVGWRAASLAPSGIADVVSFLRSSLDAAQLDRYGAALVMRYQERLAAHGIAARHLA